MIRHLLVVTAVAGALALVSGRASVGAAAAQSPATGTIVGHVRLKGPAVANPLIRMGADPLCGRFNQGTRQVQQYVLKSADGGLANAFVKLDGTFPKTPVPADPVVIDQTKCIYNPRIVGVRLGQALHIRNNDTTLHNLHGISSKGNDFNVTQPKSGMVYMPQLKAEEMMLRLKCDVHVWMTSYIGVVPHPYFGVSDTDGAFTIQKVPAGKYTIRSWHERFGQQTRTIEVKAGQTVTVELAYAGTEKSDAADLREVVIPEGLMAASLISVGPEAH